jgi:Histidine phosphatase superfamily (branch 1)
MPALLPHQPFYFLRHGQTDWNLQGRLQGHTDMPLNATGLAHARAAADMLDDKSIDIIIISPLLRALYSLREDLGADFPAAEYHCGTNEDAASQKAHICEDGLYEHPACQVPRPLSSFLSSCPLSASGCGEVTTHPLRRCDSSMRD